MSMSAVAGNTSVRHMAAAKESRRRITPFRSLASLAFGWVAYTTLCRVFVNANQTVLMVALFLVLVGMSWFYTQVFSGRAALLHLGPSPQASCRATCSSSSCRTSGSWSQT